MKALAQEWAEKTGNQLEYVSRPNSSSQTLSLFDQYWAAQSPDVDAYMIDVIWPGIAALARGRFEEILQGGRDQSALPADHRE